MERKKKICKVCEKEKIIFSKGRCQLCASLDYAKLASEKPKKSYTIPKFTLKSKARREDERAGYGDFFARHINIIKNEGKVCQECGEKLQGLSAEVCHILSKSKSPEVATNDDNILYLCFYGNSCHTKFDSSLKMRATMKVFPLAVQKYKLLRYKIDAWTSEVIQLESEI